MSVEKIKKFDTGYTLVLNQVLYDNDLSLKAKGIYAYLYSKPDNWQFKMSFMQKELKEGKNSIYSAIKELIEKGYIERTQKNENSTFGEVIYKFVCPQHKEVLAFPKNPDTGNRDTQYISINNKYINNKNPDNNKLLSPLLEKGEVPSKSVYDRFDEFYAAYPLHKSKEAARKSFEKVMKKNVPFEKLMSSLENYKQYLKENTWQNPKHPSTWLNQGCWEDEYDKKTKFDLF